MVKSLKMALFLGFLLWLVPFIVSMAIGSLRSSDRTFFETIMPVVITLAVMAFSCYYFKDIRSGPLKEGAIVGGIWLIISIVFDLFMFSWGPMAMTFTDYMKDIGLAYLIYPIVTVGIGYLLEKRNKPQA